MATKKTSTKKKIETVKKSTGKSLADKSTLTKSKEKSSPTSKKKVESKKTTPSVKKTSEKTASKPAASKNESTIFKPLDKENLTKVKSENKNDSIFSPKETTTEDLSSKKSVFSTDNKTITDSVFNSTNTDNQSTEKKSPQIKETKNDENIAKEDNSKIESIDDLLEAISIAKEKRETQNTDKDKTLLNKPIEKDNNKATSIDNLLSTNLYKKNTIDDKDSIKQEEKKTESIDNLLKTINTVKERKEDKDKSFYDKKSYNGAQYKSINKKNNKILPLSLIALFLIIAIGIVFFVINQQNNKDTSIASSVLENDIKNQSEVKNIEPEDVIDNPIINTNIADEEKVINVIDKKENTTTNNSLINKVDEEQSTKENIVDEAPPIKKEETNINKEIKVENTDNKIIVNDNIKTETAIPPVDGNYEIYTLKWKESVRTVAINKLGDERRWTTIYRLNSDTFKSPDIYFFGNKIKLPKNKKSIDNMTNEELLSLIEDYKFTISAYQKETGKQTDISRLNAIIKILNEKIK